MSRIAFICAFSVSPICLETDSNADHAPEDFAENSADPPGDLNNPGAPDIPDDLDPSSQDTALDFSDALCKPCAQQPMPLPEVKIPTAEEVARHSLTHLPYQRWCRWCVMSRMPNVAHKELPPFSRRTPPAGYGLLLYSEQG